MSYHADIGTVDRVNVTLTSSYRWKIKDFSNIRDEVGSSLLSPVITTADSSVKWHLKLYPNGKTDEYSEYISVSVYYCSEIETNALYVISIVNAENEALENFTIRKKLKLITDFESQSEAWIPYRFHPNFAERSFVADSSNNVLSDDCLTISFEVILQNPAILNPSANGEDNFRDDRLKEFDDFENLLGDERFSDVTFLVGDKKIHAHKAVLAARNVVFRNMFDSNAKERETIIEIVDLDHRVLKELFRFLYTGKVNDVCSMADDLLAAADEYCVEGLKTFCEKTLYESLEVDNVVQLIEIADIREAKLLKARALEFFADHANEIVKRDEFSTLRPDLMREVVRVMAQKQ